MLRDKYVMSDSSDSMDYELLGGGMDLFIKFSKGQDSHLLGGVSS